MCELCSVVLYQCNKHELFHNFFPSLCVIVMMPTLSPFAGFPASTLKEQLKLAEIFSLQASMTPTELSHMGKGPFSLLQSEVHTAINI